MNKTTRTKSHLNGRASAAQSATRPAESSAEAVAPLQSLALEVRRASCAQRALTKLLLDRVIAEACSEDAQHDVLSEDIQDGLHTLFSTTESAVHVAIRSLDDALDAESRSGGRRG